MKLMRPNPALFAVILAVSIRLLGIRGNGYVTNPTFIIPIFLLIFALTIEAILPFIRAKNKIKYAKFRLFMVFRFFDRLRYTFNMVHQRLHQK